MLLDVWGGDGKETCKEEFPFENFNNIITVNGLILLKGKLVMKYFRKLVLTCFY